MLPRLISKFYINIFIVYLPPYIDLYIFDLQDLYLQLDVNKSVLNMLSDEISSGSDVSGSTYKVTSSYTNGDLVRI